MSLMQALEDATHALHLKATNPNVQRMTEKVKIWSLPQDMERIRSSPNRMLA
jgi:hypothetical protein